MSGMDHGYARTKLTQLLRDLDHYNQFEFWRQMSRIAHGATSMPHAEELMAQREDARQALQAAESRAEDAEQHIAKLENARDHAVNQARIHAMEAKAQGSTVREILRLFDLPEHDWEATRLVRDALARRDALVAAEALREKGHEWRSWGRTHQEDPNDLTHSAFHFAGDLYAAAYRLSREAEARPSSLRYRPAESRWHHLDAEDPA